MKFLCHERLALPPITAAKFFADAEHLRTCPPQASHCFADPFQVRVLLPVYRNADIYRKDLLERMRSSSLINDALDRAQLVLPWISLTTLLLLFTCRRP